METFHTICECKSPEHTLHWHYFEDGDRLIMSVNLSTRPFFRRLKAGIRYIFGYTCPYGHFDEVTVGQEQREALVMFLVKKAIEKKNKRGRTGFDSFSQT